MSTEFRLPELGENVATGDVLHVLVKAGDSVARNQPVLELETDKATVEVPSSVSGQVKEILVQAGDKVKVGQAIFTLESGDQAAAIQPTPTAEPRPIESGGGPRGSTGSPRPEPAERRQEGEPASAAASSGATGAVRVTEAGDISPEFPAPAEPDAHATPAPAAPSVRRMARELGLDVNDVRGSGPDGRVSIEDVKAHAKHVITSSGKMATAGIAAEPLPDFARWGAIERQPMRALRRKTATHLSAAWATIPHVSQHDLADVTDLETFRAHYAKQVEAAGGSLTVTAILLKVVAAALKRFPQFNASVDLAAEEIVRKKYVHIGVAVDTDRGLLVPVLRDVDTKNIVQIAVELAQLSERARAGKLSLEEMQGGCFSISNLGGIGGTSFAPIVNAPEVAILGISRASWQPVWKPSPRAAGERGDGALASAHGPGWDAGADADGTFVPRLMLPLSLSYDHRAIDGADGIRFLRWMIEAIEQPFLLALQG